MSKQLLKLEKDFSVPVWQKKAFEEALEYYDTYLPTGIKSIEWEEKNCLILSVFTVILVGDARAINILMQNIELI